MDHGTIRISPDNRFYGGLLFYHFGYEARRFSIFTFEGNGRVLLGQEGVDAGNGLSGEPLAVEFGEGAGCLETVESLLECAHDFGGDVL